MSSLSAKDRVSLCSFTFADGRRCRTPRIGKHSHFCFDHAQKEARAHAAQKLGKDLAYFFSGDYLSACDLSAALGRLIPAVVRGDVKPKTARTVAYLAQTLMQAIHISQHEYINAFGTDGWRRSVRNSVKGNYDYFFPPAPESQHRESSAPATTTAVNSPAPEPQQPASAAPSPHPQHTSPPPRSVESPVNCHSERSEESASSSNSSLATHHSPLPQTPAPSPTSSRASQAPAAQTAPRSTARRPRRSDRSCLNHAASTANKIHPIPATQSAQSVMPPAHPGTSPRTGPPTPQPAPSRDVRALHFDHSCRLLIDGKPF